MENILVFTSFTKEIIENVLKGGVGVVPTDTIYGVICGTQRSEAVNRVYNVCNRDLDKPFIVVIGGFSDLEKFDIFLNSKQKDILMNYWPGEISVVLDCPQDKFTYLHRGNKNIAFRFPKEQIFLEFLKETGPLVATSANPQGEEYAKNINDAKHYFIDKMDFYIDRGEITSTPSTIIKLIDDKVKVLRKGFMKITQ